MNTTLIVLKLIIKLNFLSPSIEEQAHACAMDIEDNFTVYTYSNKVEFENQVVDCILSNRITVE